MERKTKLIMGGAAAVAVLGVGAGVGVAASGEDDQPLRGRALERATDAALAHVGDGTVVETEAGEDDAAYEVGVRLADGKAVELRLNESFEVIGSEVDEEGKDEASEDAEGD
ncbi:MAG TPA: hypothetical protein VHK89_02230 [Actinomycetota bacterium]|nr:hypothetical protein [Actinomycetota bacterium]